MRSKVRIPLGSNNSLEPVHWRSQSITRSVWRGHFIRIRGFPDRDGTQSGLTLEGFLVIRKKKKKKKKKKRKEEEARWRVWSWVQVPLSACVTYQ
jgi:hypothetical protein